MLVYWLIAFGSRVAILKISGRPARIIDDLLLATWFPLLWIAISHIHNDFILWWQHHSLWIGVVIFKAQDIFDAYSLFIVELIVMGLLFTSMFIIGVVRLFRQKRMVGVLSTFIHFILPFLLALILGLIVNPIF